MPNRWRTIAISCVELPSVASDRASARMHGVAPRLASWSYYRRERPTRGEQKTRHCLREGRTFVAGGVDQAALVEPRLTGREDLSLAAALEYELSGGQRHQLLSAMQMPWRPDAWVEVEHQVHKLECAGRPL